jgi:predicted metal-dependent HD superfamily phosphohydrolase
MVPDDEFKTGRMNFLRQLLDQRAIYLTDFFSGKYELTARANIKHALVMLSR